LLYRFSEDVKNKKTVILSESEEFSSSGLYSRKAGVYKISAKDSSLSLRMTKAAFYNPTNTCENCFMPHLPIDRA
jgi:hypothetical protein